MRGGLIAAMLFVGVCPDDAAEQASSVALGIRRLDAAGQVREFSTTAAAPARVFVFLTGECPISKAYAPTLARLAETWRETGVDLYGVWADPTTKPAAIAAFAEEYGLTFPILTDRDGELARRFGPTHVPEAFVLDPAGGIAYRGRIDDAYADLGRRRPEATERTLADAVAAVVEGKAVEKPRTEPVGCLVEPSPENDANAEVTYTRDVAPILFANCVQCHRDGEVGPFPLVSYDDAAKRSRQIATVVERKIMPPWMPGQTHGEFLGQRTLTGREIATLKTWSESGRAAGDPADLPPVPEFTPGWRLGEPDVVLEMPEDFTLHADGPDVFQNFVIPIDVPESKLVAAVDFHPGNPRVVHHVLLFLDSQGTARKLDARTPEPGYPSFGGPGFLPSGALGGWSPGNTPRRLPDGLGRFLKKGSDLVMQIHYHPDGKPAVDRSKVGVYFVDKPKNTAASVWASSYEIDLPAGSQENTVKGVYTLPKDVTMVGVVPHMHLLGRSMHAVAALPDGTRRDLIDVPDWNYNWQDEYYWAKPFQLPAGTRLEVTAVYDNSAENPSNPSSPPKRVTWGEGTADEMLYCFFLVSADNRRDLGAIQIDNLTRDAKRKLLGGE